MRAALNVKRVYEAPVARDGYRVLVDRLWPRGLTKDAAHVDLWLKDIAPSSDLRKWFNHDPARWSEFEKRYFRELETHPEELGQLLERARKGRVTLLYGAKDAEHNNAVALKEFVENGRRPH